MDYFNKKIKNIEEINNGDIYIDFLEKVYRAQAYENLKSHSVDLLVVIGGNGSRIGLGPYGKVRAEHMGKVLQRALGNRFAMAVSSVFESFPWI